MSVVIGIDASSKKVACAVTIGAKFGYAATVLPKDNDKSAACHYAYTFTLKFLRDILSASNFASDSGGFVNIFLERLLVSPGRIGATLPQAQVAGAVMAAVGFFQARGEASLGLVQVGSWKKAVVGHGRASKAEVAAHLSVRWPAAYRQAHPKGKLDQDLVDAACINIYGRLALGLDRTTEGRRCLELFPPGVRRPQVIVRKKNPRVVGGRGKRKAS